MGLARWAGPVLALTLMVLPAGAQTDLTAMHDATLEAFQTGDMALAMDRAQAALAYARTAENPDPGAYGFALNNVAFLLNATGGDLTKAAALWAEAIDYLAARNLLASDAGFSATLHLAGLEARQGHKAQAAERISQAVRLARGTGYQAQVAGAAATSLMDMGAYQDAVVAFSEMALLDAELIRDSYADVYVQLNTALLEAEADGRSDDLIALNEAKIIVAQIFVPQEARDDAIRDLRFQRYFALNDAGQFERADAALTAWLASGPHTESEQEFIAGMAATATAFANGADIQTVDDLQTARTAIAMLRALDMPDDPELGRALRAVALAEAQYGYFERAVDYLTDAVTILARSPAGRTHLSETQAELAWYLHQIGDSDQAAAVYAQSDDLPAPNPPPLDGAEFALNRASFHIDLRQYDLAKAKLAQAATLLGAQPGSPRKIGLTVSLLTLQAFVSAEVGDPWADHTALLVALDDQRGLETDAGATFSLNLVNAANAMAMSGAFEGARALVQEAVAINATALPGTAPQALDTFAMLQQLNLVLGDRQALIDNLRSLTSARQAPAYRDRLADSSWDFELFAWALLADPDARSPARIGEAFEALQYTQITRSAAALGVLETRMAVADPGRGAMLRERQDLVAAFEDVQARLSAARMAGSQRAALALSDQLTEVENQLAQVNATLDALGLDIGGIGQVDPLTLADTQTLLAADEALVTFLLPSLNPDVVPGVNGSSNHVLVVTRNAVHVAQIGEVSRRRLNTRINTFRCDIAISDPGCETGGAHGLRGAMLAEDDTESETYFDQDAALALYSDLFAGVETVLKLHPNLIIVPPSDMLRLPFEALVTSVNPTAKLANMEWLIRRHAVSVLPSISSLRSLRGGAQNDRPLTSMLGFGDPVIGKAGPMDCDGIALASLRGMPPVESPLSGATTAEGLPLADVDYLSRLPRLPDSRCELQAIQTAFKNTSRLVLGADATETEIKTMDASGALAGYDVLVFATHGLTAGESGADSPGLVLTPPDVATGADDGLLTASEIATLDLNARLVVLSACNTAAGDGRDADGLSGLARAFFQSGAQSLLVTHWSVYSEAAVDVTTGLFDAYNRDQGQSYAAALQSSVLSVLDDPGRPAFHHHPSYWAAFAIVGAH